jgi:signal transduction histidine kinase
VYQDDVFDPDPGCPKIPEDSMQLGIRSFAAIPLKRQERILGVLFINSQEPIRFDDETQHTLSILASHAGVAIEIAELHETAFHASLIKAADLGYLASGISHEFLNSLQNIRILEGKLRRTAMDPESQRTLDSLLKEYDEAVRSIDTFKSFRDREILDDPVDLDALVSSVIALSERRAIDHRISLVYLPGNLPRVRVDTSLIRSIIVNLLHNAMDAVEGAPGERRVQLQIQRTDEQHFEIAVRDSGVGIAPDVKKKMFIPFFTTKKPKNMGVGLFWVQRIVQRLNGRLVVEPKNEMGGATFRVLLPLVT